MPLRCLFDLVQLVARVGGVACFWKRLDDAVEEAFRRLDVAVLVLVEVGELEHEEGGIVLGPFFRVQRGLDRVDRGVGVMQLLELDLGDLDMREPRIGFVFGNRAIGLDGSLVVALGQLRSGLAVFVRLDLLRCRVEQVADPFSDRREDKNGGERDDFRNFDCRFEIERKHIFRPTNGFGLSVDVFTRILKKIAARSQRNEKLQFGPWAHGLQVRPSEPPVQSELA